MTFFEIKKMYAKKGKIIFICLVQKNQRVLDSCPTDIFCTMVLRFQSHDYLHGVHMVSVLIELKIGKTFEGYGQMEKVLENLKHTVG